MICNLIYLPVIGVNATGDTGDTSPGNIWSTGDEVPYILGKVCQVSAVACLTVRTRCGAAINSSDTKTIIVNHSCRHFRMNFCLNLVPLVLHRRTGTHDALYSANAVVNKKGTVCSLIPCSCSLVPSAPFPKLHSRDAWSPLPPLEAVK